MVRLRLTTLAASIACLYTLGFASADTARGPNWPEMATEALAQLAAHPNPAALQGTAAALAQLQNHLTAIVARGGGYT